MISILKYPDARLKRASKEITVFDENLHTLLDGMAKAMYESNGVGLAAPQVGESIRAFLIDVEQVENEKRKLYEMINPVLSEGSGTIVYEEGCLSLPGYTQEVERKANIRVDYCDRYGKPHILVAQDLLAVALQHENDHLDGILIVDRLSPLKRKLVKRQLAKSLNL